MKGRFNYFAISFILFFIPFNLFCQLNLKDSAECYNYWAKRGIIEIVFTSMEDYSKTLTEAEQQGKKQYYEIYIKGINNLDLSQIDHAYKEIEQFLNGNSYGKTANNFLNPLQRNFEQKKPLDDIFFIVPNNYKNSQNWEKKKLELLKNYHYSLNNLIEPAKASEDGEKKSESNDTELPKEKIISGWKWTIIIFLIGFIIGASIIYLGSQLKIYSILKIEKKKYLNILIKDTDQNLIFRKCFKYIGVVEVVLRRKNEKQKEINDLKEAIALLKEQNERLNSGEKQIEEVLVKQIVPEDNQELVSDRLDEKPSTFSEVSINKIEIFFTIPENDGSFKTVNAKYNKEVDCFYKIELDNSSQRGKLEFISGDYDLRALDNIDYYLNPVCEIQNIADRKSARRIQMINPGIVIKSGDHWKIDEKSKVKIKLV